MCARLKEEAEASNRQLAVAEAALVGSKEMIANLKGYLTVCAIVLCRPCVGLAYIAEALQALFSSVKGHLDGEDADFIASTLRRTLVCASLSLMVHTCCSTRSTMRVAVRSPACIPVMLVDMLQGDLASFSAEGVAPATNVREGQVSGMDNMRP
jgi:hypothetical protein